MEMIPNLNLHFSLSLVRLSGDFLSLTLLYGTTGGTMVPLLPTKLAEAGGERSSRFLDLEEF